MNLLNAGMCARAVKSVAYRDLPPRSSRVTSQASSYEKSALAGNGVGTPGLALVRNKVSTHGMCMTTTRYGNEGYTGFYAPKRWRKPYAYTHA